MPAFYGLYFLGSKDRILPKLGKLALATLLLLVISLSWAFVVDSTPASQRPYVGSSGDNSVLSLITGYNGIDRLLGMGGGRAGFGGGPFGGGGPPNGRLGSLATASKGDPFFRCERARRLEMDAVSAGHLKRVLGV